MSLVKGILSAKCAPARTISSSEDVLSAIMRMNAERIGCLIVTDDDANVKGTIAERDILRSIVRQQHDLSRLTVGEVMVERVIACHVTGPLTTIRSIMKTHWVRQIPVVDDEGKLQGIISMGDVNASLLDEEDIEIKYLHDYIEGRVR